MLEFLKGIIENKEYNNIPLEWVKDIGINPRKLDIEYAKTIPVETTPILLGLVTGEKETDFGNGPISLENVLFIVDGNHRTYSKKNIHQSEFVNAKIKKFETLDDAIIDAYKCNTSHGKLLDDRDIAKGVDETVRILRYKFINGKTTKKPTLVDIAKNLGITERQVRLYISWTRLEKTLGEKISKKKADILSPFVNDRRELSVEEQNAKLVKLKEFWRLNKELTIIDMIEAKKIFVQTGEVVNYTEHKVSEMLDLGLDDPIEETVEETTDRVVELTGKERVVTERTDSIDVDENGFTQPKSLSLDDIISPKNSKEETGRSIVPEPKRISEEIFATNVLKTMQEEMLDKVAIFKDMLTNEKNAETKAKLISKASDFKGILNNLQSIIAEMVEVVEQLN